MKSLIHLTVNDKEYEVAVQPNQTLVDVLRYELRLTGTKKGCGTGDCGSCTVIMDGKPVNSCLVLAVQANGRKITTIEGLESEEGLHPVQKAFIGKRGHPVRVLLLRHDSLLEKPAGQEPETDRRGNSARLIGKSLQMHRISKDSRCCKICIQVAFVSNISQQANEILSRRYL